jgi:hypothetical protein
VRDFYGAVSKHDWLECVKRKTRFILILTFRLAVKRLPKRSVRVREIGIRRPGSPETLQITNAA